MHHGRSVKVNEPQPIFTLKVLGRKEHSTCSLRGAVRKLFKIRDNAKRNIQEMEVDLEFNDIRGQSSALGVEALFLHKQV